MQGGYYLTNGTFVPLVGQWYKLYCKDGFDMPSDYWYVVIQCGISLEGRNNSFEVTIFPYLSQTKEII